MLRRQQAAAVVAARREIVDGAVGMVELALEQLSAKRSLNLMRIKKRRWLAICWLFYALKLTQLLLSTLAPSVIDQRIFPCAEDK